MDVSDIALAKSRLRELIISHSFVKSDAATIVRRDGTIRKEGWLFDIRKISLQGHAAHDIARLFWHTFLSRYPFQVGGMESAAIPLIAGIVAYGYGSNMLDIAGFYIRKSRKKDGLMQVIEGTIQEGRSIILVDDLMNSGLSLVRQVEILESLGHTVQAVWTLLRFREPEFYDFFTKKGISIHSVFTLEDFREQVATYPLSDTSRTPAPTPFTIHWKFQAGSPSYNYVVPKSAPALDDERVYIGSDSGILWALNQSDGSIVWSFQTRANTLRKGIFSSPLVCGDTVYVGSYDGNVYALDSKTGRKRWVYLDADWVGSSPVPSPDGTVIYIGLEFGLWKKRGGIVALDALTGKKRWWYPDMPCFTHATPLYIEHTNEVAIGSNDGAVYLFDAAHGTLKWKYASGVLTDQELQSGFSSVDIKESLAFDEQNDRIIMANKKGVVCFLDRTTGFPHHTFDAEAGFFSTPIVYGDSVYVTSLDKHLYCLDRATAQLKWKWYAAARIFASPIIIEDSLFVGANSGCMTEIDPLTGDVRSVFIATERITNSPAFNPATKRFFISTFANELYCASKQAYL